MNETNLTTKIDGHLRMTLAPRPEALGAETKYLEERLRAFRDRISIVATDEESWRILRACDALASVSTRLSEGGVKQ